MYHRIAFSFLCLVLPLVAFAQLKFQQKSGTYTYYGENSRTTVPVKNYFAHGKYVTKTRQLLPNGKVKWVVTCSGRYLNGYLDGYYLLTTVNGDTIETGNYKSGGKIGQWRGYKDGKPTYVYNFEEGKYLGWQHEYRTNGEVSRKGFYPSPGTHYEWYYAQNNQLISRGQYVSDSLRNGQWLWYDTTLHVPPSPADTLPTRICWYTQGKKNGSDQVFEHGVLLNHESYLAGIRQGSSIDYYNGVMVREENYNNGMLSGPSRRRTQSGKVISEYHYHEGKLHMTSTDYDTITGNPAREQVYENGVLISLKEYSGKTIIKEQILVERDSLVYTYKEFYPSGARKSHGRMIGTRRTGSYEYWHANGKRKMTAAFRNDEFIGTLNIWNDKGVKVFQSKVWNSRDTLKEDVWSDAGAKLSYGTNAYFKQRAKYIPEGVVAWYDEFASVGQVIIKVYPKNPWEDEPQKGVSSAAWHESSLMFESPSYPGEDEALRTHVDSVAVYPAYEFEEHIEGENVVTFTLRDDGTIAAVKIERSLSPGLDAASMEIVRTMPVWIPAKRYGQNCEVRCWIEIEWRIGEFK